MNHMEVGLNKANNRRNATEDENSRIKARVDELRRMRMTQDEVRGWWGLGVAQPDSRRELRGSPSPSPNSLPPSPPSETPVPSPFRTQVNAAHQNRLRQIQAEMGRNLLHSDLVYAEAAVFRKKTEDMIEENQVGLLPGRVDGYW